MTSQESVVPDKSLTKPPHIPAIDALRGIAVLCVLSTHTARFHPPTEDWLTVLTNAGNRGVQLFYLLSAFTLCLAFEAQVNRASKFAEAIADFWIRRFFRIVPLFYAAILLSLWVNGTGPRYWAPDGISLRDVFLTFSFLNAWDPGSISSIVEGGWSVALEMNFYLIFPFLFILLRNRLSVAIALVVAFWIFYFSRLTIQPLVSGLWPAAQAYLPSTFFELLSLPAELPVFVLGIFLYRCYPELEKLQQVSILRTWLALPAVLLSGAFFYWFCRTPYHSAFPKHFEQTLAFLPLIGGLIVSPAGLFVNPVTRFLGSISFSIYLTHNYAIVIVGNALGARSHSVPFALALTLVILVSVLLSTFTFFIIEKPCRQWGYDWWKRVVRQQIGFFLEQVKMEISPKTGKAGRVPSREGLKFQSLVSPASHASLAGVHRHIRFGSADDVPELVDIHLKAFPGFFLSVLGARFLRQLYNEVIADETGVVLIYADETGVRGFVAGSFLPAGLFGRLVRRSWLRFALASVAPAMRRPQIAFRLFRALRKPSSEQSAIKAALLMSLAVAPESQGMGIGGTLTESFCRVCFAHGFPKVKLTTDKVENEAVNAFYRRQGFVVLRSFTTAEGREMNEYVRESTESSFS